MVPESYKRSCATGIGNRHRSARMVLSGCAEAQPAGSAAWSERDPGAIRSDKVEARVAIGRLREFASPNGVHAVDLLRGAAEPTFWALLPRAGGAPATRSPRRHPGIRQLRCAQRLGYARFRSTLPQAAIQRAQRLANVSFQPVVHNSEGRHGIGTVSSSCGEAVAGATRTASREAYDRSDSYSGHSTHRPSLSATTDWFQPACVRQPAAGVRTRPTGTRLTSPPSMWLVAVLPRRCASPLR